MRILFVNTTLAWGGGEIWIMDMLSGLRERGHEVSLLCARSSDLAERARAERFAAIPSRIGGDLDPVVIWHARQAITRNRIELVCTNTEKALRLAGIAAKLSGGIPVVACREVDRAIKSTAAYRISYGWLASALTVNSRATLTTLLESAPWLAGRPITVIYKGIRLSEGTKKPKGDLAREFGFPEKAPVVCFVGRLDEQKGISYLLDAWVRVRKKRMDARLLFIGEGNLQEFIGKFVADHGLGECVRLAGFRRDPRALLPQCAMLVLPSLWEGFGYAALEAMAAGLPVVASRTSSLPEVIVDRETGILVEPRDAGALADALLEILDDKRLSLKLGAAGRRRAEQRFSMRNMVDEFEQLFVRLVGHA